MSDSVDQIAKLTVSDSHSGLTAKVLRLESGRIQLLINPTTIHDDGAKIMLESRGDNIYTAIEAIRDDIENLAITIDHVSRNQFLRNIEYAVEDWQFACKKTGDQTSS